MKAADETPDAAMDEAQFATDVLEAQVLADLRERILASLEPTGKPIDALQALVEVDPIATLRWLLSLRIGVEAADGEFSAGISRVLLRAFAALAGRPEAAETLGQAVMRFSELLQPEEILLGARALRACGREAAAQDLIEAAIASAPNHPGLLRDVTNRTVRAGKVEAHRWLSRLARVDTGAATALRVYRSRAKLPQQMELQPLRVALLSSFTIDPVVPYLDLELRDLDLVPNLYVAPFDTWEREVLDPDAELRQFDPEIAYLAVSIDDLCPELGGPLDAAALAQMGKQAVDRVIEAACHFASWSEAVLVVHSFHSVHRGPLGILEGRAGPSRSRWLALLNADLADRLAELRRAYLLDMSELLLLRPGGAVDNPKMRHMAAMRISEGISAEVARAYARYAAPLVGRVRKCVVVDLDNTLWGGVVGEDGPSGIKLGPNGPGSEFQEFQRYLLALSQQGILLAISSKNNPEDAWQVIREHEGMILREEHFSAARINWQPKPENLMEIARELNIGVDSLIFVDDNPNERERVRHFLPEVLVPELPTDPALYRRTLEMLPALQRLEATAEDHQRVALYREKRDRERAREKVTSVAEYLKNLTIRLEIAPAEKTTLPRVHQLFQRTNQFNATTRRYDAGALAKISSDPDSRLYTLRARDRFGDHGLVAVALVRTNDTDGAWRVDSFLMSCRVIGYGIETALLAVVSEDALSAGAKRLRGEYTPTPKNPPVADLYTRHGFEKKGAEGETSLFERGLNDGPIPRPDWLELDVHHEA